MYYNFIRLKSRHREMSLVIKSDSSNLFYKKICVLMKLQIVILVGTTTIMILIIVNRI